MKIARRFSKWFIEKAEEKLFDPLEWREKWVFLLIVAVTIVGVFILPTRSVMPLISWQANLWYSIVVAIDGFAFLVLFFYGYITLGEWNLEMTLRPNSKSVLDTDTIVVFVIQSSVLTLLCLITMAALVATLIDMGGSQGDQVITVVFSIIFIAGALFGAYSTVFGVQAYRRNSNVMSLLST